MQNRTTFTAIAAVCAAIVIANPAHATGSHPSPPTSTPAPQATPPVHVVVSPSASSSATSGSLSVAKSDATAGAAASTGPVSATGGTAGGGAGGQATAAAGDSSAMAGHSQSNLTTGDSYAAGSRALGLSFAPGAFTPPMAPVQCGGAMIKQEAGNIGMGLLSHASASTDSSDCTLIQIRNAMVSQCRYASARQVEDMIVQRHLPKFQPGRSATGDVLDYSPAECAVLTAPPQPKQQVLNWVYVPPPVARIEEKLADPKPEPVKPTKLIKRKPGKSNFQACGDGGVPQCVPAPANAMVRS